MHLKTMTLRKLTFAAPNIQAQFPNPDIFGLMVKWVSYYMETEETINSPLLKILVTGVFSEFYSNPIMAH